MSDAMNQAWEHYRLHGVRPIPTWEGIVEDVERRAFAAGWAARDAEVAELRQRLADVTEQRDQERRECFDALRIVGKLNEEVAELERRIKNREIGAVCDHDLFIQRQEERDAARAEVAELQERLRTIVVKTERPPLRHQDDLPGDDPLTMPVERLRECVAKEVMGWQDNWGQADDWWYRHLTQHSQKGMVRKADFDPLTNPLHTHMVREKMQEQGWQLFVSPFPAMTEPPMNSTILPAPIWYYRVGFVNWNGKEVATEASSTEKVNEAICRAALLAVRTRE